MRSDNGALRQQIVSNIARLRRYAFALTGTVHDADDLLQTTVERVLRKGAPKDAELVRWMFRVCKNIWIDEIRARRVRVAAIESGKVEVAPPVDGERLVMGRLTLAQVNGAMAQLADGQRSVLSLVALEGYTYRETAEILEMPIGTVMSRLARARRTLSKLLAAAENRAVAATAEPRLVRGNDD